LPAYYADPNNAHNELGWQISNNLEDSSQTTFFIPINHAANSRDLIKTQMDIWKVPVKLY
jgi:hypothetical protein